MKNQHKKIKGYRDLNQKEIDMMNKIKKKAEEVGEIADDIAMLADTDKRWAAIGKTNLQQGFMALVRSVAKPESF